MLGRDSDALSGCRRNARGSASGRSAVSGRRIEAFALEQAFRQAQAKAVSSLQRRAAARSRPPPTSSWIGSKLPAGAFLVCGAERIAHGKSHESAEKRSRMIHRRFGADRTSCAAFAGQARMYSTCSFVSGTYGQLVARALICQSRFSSCSASSADSPARRASSR